MMPKLSKVVAFLLTCVFIIPLSVSAAQDAGCIGTLPGRLTLGGLGRVLPGTVNNLRATPSTEGEIVGIIPPYAIFTVADAPVCAEGYTWWFITYPDSETYAWVAEASNTDYWLEPYTHPEPETLLTPRDTEGQAVIEVSYQGISFSLPREFAAGVMVEHAYPNIISNSMSSPMAGSPIPDGLIFTFLDADEQFLNTRIAVYALADFAKLPDGVPDILTHLKDLIDSKGEPDTSLAYSGAYLTLLPDMNPPTLFQDVYRYIDFQNGSGLSYFAAYSFGVEPINYLTYTYTGLTTDGLYYVTLQQPMSVTPMDIIDTENMDWEAFESNFETYRDELSVRLSVAAPEDFTPNLDVLDSIIMSLDIQPAP